eukprot:4194903-Pyramimonas_sp.AAC.1
MLFFTQLDWNVIANPNVHWTSDLKATTVATRLIKGGFYKPSETAAADLVAMLAAAVDASDATGPA